MGTKITSTISLPIKRYTEADFPGKSALSKNLSKIARNSVKEKFIKSMVENVPLLFARSKM